MPRGSLHINLLAVRALTGVQRRQHGNAMGCATPDYVASYQVYVSGMREAIVRRVEERGLDEPGFQQERQDLLTSLALVHAPTLPKGVA